MRASVVFQQLPYLTAVLSICVSHSDGFLASKNAALFVPSPIASATVSDKSSKVHSSTNDDSFNEESSNYILPAWWLPSQNHESEARKERFLKMQEDMQRFAQGTKLQSLRSDIGALKNNLKWALVTDDLTRIVSLSSAIAEKQERDPEFVYDRALEKIADTRSMSVRKKYQLLPKYTEEALAARKFIPRLNMEGLWMGNFGADGSGLVNVTYSGDILIATKVTGKSYVQRGEVAFRADLGPRLEDKSKSQLAPIRLTGPAAKKWGTGNLERYAAEGQVASEDSKDRNFVEGQLIMFDGYFSFLYLPSKQHIFFSRPNPELTLHLMRDTISEEDEIQNMREHLSACFEKDIDSAFIGPEKEVERKEPFRRILREDDLVSAQEEVQITYDFSHLMPKSASFINSSKFSIWAIHKWKNYIDAVLKPNRHDGGTLNSN